MINVSQKVENPVKVVYFYADYSDLFRPKDTETLVCWAVRNISTGEVSGLYEDQEEAEDNTCGWDDTIDFQVVKLVEVEDE